jgi:hypothetical protein
VRSESPGFALGVLKRFFMFFRALCGHGHHKTPLTLKESGLPFSHPATTQQASKDCPASVNDWLTGYLSPKPTKDFFIHNCPLSYFIF